MLTRREFNQLALTLASGAGVSVALGGAMPLGGPLPASVGACQGMKTRGVALLVGNVQISLPHTAIAPVADRMVRIGVLTSFAADDAGWQRNFAAFAAALSDAGWKEGETLRFETRHVPGARGAESFRAAARELAALAPDAILAAPLAASTAWAYETINQETLPQVCFHTEKPANAG